MDFIAVVDQAITLLRQRGCLTYRTLQRQFQLDDAALDDLKDELIYGQRLAVDEEGRVLVWSGETKTSAPAASAQATPAVLAACLQAPVLEFLSRSGDSKGEGQFSDQVEVAQRFVIMPYAA